MCVCFFNCFIIYTNLPAGKSSIMMHIMSQAPPSPPPPANTHYYLPVDGNIKLFFDVSVLYHFYDKRSRSIVLNRGIGPGKSGERGFFRLRAPTSPNSRRGLLLRSTFGITWNHWNEALKLIICHLELHNFELRLRLTRRLRWDMFPGQRERNLLALPTTLDIYHDLPGPLSTTIQITVGT